MGEEQPMVSFESGVASCFTNYRFLGRSRLCLFPYLTNESQDVVRRPWGSVTQRDNTYVHRGVTSKHSTQSLGCTLSFSLPLGTCHFLPGVSRFSVCLF